MKRVSAFSLSAPCYYYVSWCNHGLLSCGTCHSLMFESDWLICNLRVATLISFFSLFCSHTFFCLVLIIFEFDY
ncbi:hypothetical protein ACB092_08G118500 [Castanea dentata]